MDQQERALKPPKPTFYRPGFGETAAAMGWKWMSVVPAMALVGALAAAPRMLAIALLWKLGWLLFAWPVILFANTRRNAIKARVEPFCVACGYDLTGLPDKHHCPECGRLISLTEIAAYRRDPVNYAEMMRIQQSQAPAHARFEALPRKRPKSRDGT